MRGTFVSGMLTGAVLGVVAVMLMSPQARQDMADGTGSRLQRMMRRGREQATEAMGDFADGER